MLNFIQYFVVLAVTFGLFTLSVINLIDYIKGFFYENN